MRRPTPQVDADVAELRDIAELFSKQGKRETADFLRAVATRYEVVSGAYRTASAALVADKRMPIDSDELQSAAEAFAEWSDGAAYFKYHAFARWVEQRHGILEREAWEIARDICS